jgi:aminoglycoside phosphotransferase (APT) family kinase protein
VPTPYYLDPCAELFSTPCLVIEYVEGQPEFAPSNPAGLVRKLATTLARIHRLDGVDPDLSFLPRQGKGFGERPATLDGSLDEGRIRNALESTWPLRRPNAPALLHGDFWPGNVLWKDGRLVAVIDWEDAALGDRLADVANARLEILWAFGTEAMHTFTAHYRSTAVAIDYTNLPYWDLCAALRPASRLADWGLDRSTESAMREGHKRFIAQAFATLSALCDWE